MACACECLGLLVDYQQSKEGFDSGLQNEVLGIARNEATDTRYGGSWADSLLQKAAQIFRR